MLENSDLIAKPGLDGHDRGAKVTGARRVTPAK